MCSRIVWRGGFSSDGERYRARGRVRERRGVLESCGVGYRAVRRGRDGYRAIERVESIWRGWWPRGGGERSGEG